MEAAYKNKYGEWKSHLRYYDDYDDLIVAVKTAYVEDRARLEWRITKGARSHDLVVEIDEELMAIKLRLL